MPIQAVFFDMGGTIETFHHDRESRLRAVPGLRERLRASGINFNLTDEQFLKMFTDQYQRYHSWRKDTKQELSTWQIWSDYILADYPEYHQALKDISEDLTLYYETHFYHREMRPEIPSVLEAIQKMGLKIGVISNVTSLGQVPLNLEKYGIRHYFNPVVLSSEYGRRKPDPAIFHYAARLANVPTSRCLYVGDLISRDVIGARRAGYRLAVQIQHDFSMVESGNDAVPDMCIEEMTELLDILQQENSQTTAPMKGTIRAILFDAGDILYTRQETGQQFKEFLKELSINSISQHHQGKKEIRDQAYKGLISQDAYWEEFIRLHGINHPKQIQRGKQILASDGDNVHFFEGVSDTLAALKKMGFLLGIITDTATSVSTKLKWFEKGGFGTVWDSIISSNEVGVCKPDPLIYQAALNQLGVSAEQAAFVGHCGYELDGARAVGMRTIAFNYEQQAKADFFIERFADLLNVPMIAIEVPPSPR
jgi:putative hydrolase of the HAD superfamily